MLISSVSVEKRNIKESTRVKFMEAIAMSPTVSEETVDVLLDHFNLLFYNNYITCYFIIVM